MAQQFIMLFIFFFTLAYNSNAQIIWQKCLGGTHGENAYSIQQTTDGGFIVAGNAGSINGDVSINYGIYDYWIVKLDNNGSIQWQKSFGYSGFDIPYSIQQTDDKGYIIAGLSCPFQVSLGDNYWIVKLDSAGNLKWQKNLGGSTVDKPYSIQQTNDRGYIVAGYSSSIDGDVTGNHGMYDYWIVKLDSIGNLQWQKSLGGSKHDESYAIQQTIDGGYIVAGRTLSTDGDVTGNHGSFDYWIVKLNNTGTIQWQKTLGGTLHEHATSIQQTRDDGYIVAGYTYSNDGDVTGNHGGDGIDYWIVKLDTVGNIQWQNALGGSSVEVANSVQQTNDGGYIVAGNTQSNDGDVSGNHGYEDYWIVKLDTLGNIQWQKCLGGTDYDFATSIRQTIDGAYIIAGYTYSNDGDVSGNHQSRTATDYWIVKIIGGQQINVNATVTKTLVNCTNPNSGSATINVTQGTAPYTYLWSNGATTATVTGLAVGTYTATVTDSWGNYYSIPSINITKQRCFTLGPSPINVPFIQLPGAIIPR